MVIRALSEGEVRGYGPAVLAALVPGSGGKPAEAALSPVRFRALALLFVVSGGAGLVDQVCFSKYLSYVVGATAYAVSAVLAAFMTGLTLGAALGGRLSSRVRRPLVAYGIAELLVAVAVVATPAAFGVLTPVYVGFARSAQGSLVAISAARWAIALLFVVVPTVAMGATLPLVSAAIGSGVGSSTRERRLGALYAANTFGGGVGALLGAYFVLPALGLSKTLYASALASAVAGAVAIALGWSLRTARASSAVPEVPLSVEARPPAPLTAASSLGAPWLAALAFASGFLVFTAEVVSTHLLAVIVGNSAYAFGLILAAFLLCLFLGAALTPWFSRRLGDGALATSLALTALAMACTLPFWDDLPLTFAGLGEHIRSFEGREAMRAAVAIGILALPATAMGLTFPLLLQWAASHAEVGALVGRLTAINTIGAVTGALATGYVILPALGSERTLLAVLATFGVLSVATVLLGKERRGRAALGLSAVATAIAVSSPRWVPESLTLGTNVYFDGEKRTDRVLSFREDVHGGITTVAVRGDGVHFLYTNGKFQGNDGWEMNAQHYFAHYPSLFVRRFDRALVIGLGTATTLGTLEQYPWKHLDVVEISPAIVEAARGYFAHSNHDALADRRVTLHTDDARNHLLVHEAQYDMISMELSSVWFAGAASLYSGEYYRLVRAHLTDEGVFQQWVQLHHVHRPVFARLLHTLRREFEHVALFYGGGQGILVASKRPLRWSRQRTREIASRPGFGAALPEGRPLEVLTNDILVLDAALDRFVQDSADQAGTPLDRFVSTDDNLFLEYETPRGNVLPWTAREALVAELRSYRDERAILELEEHEPTLAAQ